MYSNLKGQARLEAEGRDVVMAFVDMHTLKECAIEYGFFLSDGSTPNGGAFHNALVRLGWKDKGASREGGTTVRKGKIKGCLPRRLDNAVLKGAGKVWDTDDEDWSEPTWEDFLIACNNVGGDHHGIENWIQSLSKRLKGDELSNFSDWIESNRANDAAIAAASVGVIPMIISKSSLWGPLATVICFGLIFAMILSLYVLPVLYEFVTKNEKQIPIEENV